MRGLVSKMKGRRSWAEMAWCLARDLRTRPLSPGSLLSFMSSTDHLPAEHRMDAGVTIVTWTPHSTEQPARPDWMLHGVSPRDCLEPCCLAVSQQVNIWMNGYESRRMAITTRQCYCRVVMSCSYFLFPLKDVCLVKHFVLYMKINIYKVGDGLTAAWPTVILGDVLIYVLLLSFGQDPAVNQWDDDTSFKRHMDIVRVISIKSMQTKSEGVCCQTHQCCSESLYWPKQ